MARVFGPLEENFGSFRFYKNEGVAVVVRECLGNVSAHFHRDANFKLVPRWEKCVTEYVEK
jgi:hypothetical protein